jgi:hypothetical protein
MNDYLGSSLEFSDVAGYSSLQKSGTHHLEGIFIAQGEMVKDMDSLEGARIIDLAPTILYFLGEDISPDMDGTVLKQIIRDEFVSAHPVRLGFAGDPDKAVAPSSYSDQEERHVKEKLRGLGYID